MKSKAVVVATGIYPPDVGGPAYYAKSLSEALARRGIRVKVKAYGLEKRLPTGLRHLWYALRLIPAVIGSQGIIALDTFSVGLPAVLIGRLFRKPVMIRVGGDFLWEQYVERTQTSTILRTFYATKLPDLTLKEKVTFWLTRQVLRFSTKVVFSTAWQATIWQEAYGLSIYQQVVIENFYARTKVSENDVSTSGQKVFLWAGRSLYLKNVSRLVEAAALAKAKDPTIELKLLTGVSQASLFEELRQAYAVVVPSLSEVSPNLVLEAIMYNKPVIVTKENGLMDRLGDRVVYLDPVDIDDIAKKLLALADPRQYADYVAKVSNLQFDHSYDDIAQEFSDLFLL